MTCPWLLGPQWTQPSQCFLLLSYHYTIGLAVQEEGRTPLILLLFPTFLTILTEGQCRPCFSSSDVFCFAFLSISLLASVSLPLFFLRPCLIHARLPEGGRAFVHGHTFLHSWSGPAAWSCVPVQSYTCSLRVFYKTSAVGKETY